VTFQFGPFQLDEPGRILRLAEREMPLQPRVFNLLVYLIERRARVVSKDELLDALWPGVTVTEGSLQRAISTLRATLREGGMERTIRSFPRVGYRFSIEEEVLAPELPTADCNKDRSDGLAAAHLAVEEQRWTVAVAHFTKADTTTGLAGSDLHHWALALQCLGQPSEAIAVLIRSVAAHTLTGDKDAAAEDAVALSTIHLERNEAAVAKGWLARAQDLLAGRSASLTTGRLYWMQSRIAAVEGDPLRALELADEAYRLGQRVDDLEVEALGLMYRGFFKLSLGDTRAGLADQDHAAAMALSSSVHPITGGVLYCNILWACRTFGDWARASQWTLGYQQFCAKNRMEFSGSCQLHRAEVLGIQGSLRAALAHVREALNSFSDDAPWAMGDAHRVLGDIHAAIGDTDAAFSAYEQAYTLGWDPEPGRAMLLLERGEAEAAFVSLERSLNGQTWWTLQRQGVLLAHLALVAAHAGRHERSQALIDDLAGQAERWPMPSIRALTNEAAACLAQRRGETEEAISRLHLARQLWTSIESPFHAARLRLLVSELQLELNDASGAATELRVASLAADELESEKLRRACRALEAKLQDVLT